MAWMIELEREGEDHIRVTWVQGAQLPKSRLFDSRDAAESFAMSKMNKRNGQIISTLDMSADQLRLHGERKARARAWMAQRQ